MSSSSSAAPGETLPRRFLSRVRRHDVSALSAQAAYHSLLSLFPWLVLIEFTARLFPRFRESLWLPLWETVLRELPQPMAAGLRGLSTEAQGSPHSSLVPLALVVTLWSASSVVRVLNKALDRAFEVPPLRLHGLRNRLLSLAVVLGASLALGLLSWVVFILPRLLPPFLALLEIKTRTQVLLSRLTVPAGLIGVYLTAFGLYALLPHQRPAKRSLAWGALLATLGWLAAGRVLAWIMPRAQSLQGGPLGAILACMIFVYVSAWIFISSAELVAVISPNKAKQKHSAAKTQRH